MQLDQPDIFGQAVQHVLTHEGGYVNDPRDPGGETKYGISKRSYPHLNIANLTRGDAYRIYYQDFYRAARLELMPSSIAFFMLDTVVNLGISRGTRLLQKSVGIKADGVIGPVSLAAIRAADQGELLQELVAQRGYYYATLDSLDDRFGLGWMRRLVDTYTKAHALL